MKQLYNKYFMIMMACVAAMFASCHNDEPVPPPGPEPDPDPVVPAQGRTVLVYMVANNNMGGIYDKYDIREMQSALADGGIDNGRLLVYNGGKTDSYLLEILGPAKNDIDTLVKYESDVISVSAAQMQRVIADTKALAPAADYGLVLWSHGSGWLQNGMNETVAGPQRAFGLDGNNRMNVTTLAQVLEPEGFGFVYFDACYMASVEVAYQLRRATPVIIASPTETPIYGMPYDLNVSLMFEPEIDYETVAKNTFDYYNNKFRIGDCPCTMTVIRTGAIDELANATRAVYERAQQRWPDGYCPQRYTDDSRCYYYDFGDYIQTLCDDQALLNSWQEAMNVVVTYKAATPYIWDTIPITRCSGISTYIFGNDESPDTRHYDQLDWYADVACALF